MKQEQPQREVTRIQIGPLTFVYYRDEELHLHCAHCLELDMGGQGASQAEATEDLQDALEVYLLHCLENEEPLELGNTPQELRGIKDRQSFFANFLKIEQAEGCPAIEQIFFDPPPPQQFNPAVVAQAG